MENRRELSWKGVPQSSVLGLLVWNLAWYMHMMQFFAPDHFWPKWKNSGAGPEGGTSENWGDMVPWPTQAPWTTQLVSGLMTLKSRYTEDSRWNLEEHFVQLVPPSTMGSRDLTSSSARSRGTTGRSSLPLYGRCTIHGPLWGAHLVERLGGKLRWKKKDVK